MVRNLHVAQILQPLIKQTILSFEEVRAMLPAQIQTGRPQTTAHLTQTMTLLGMTSVELTQTVETELANNPALEIIEEFRCLNCGRRLRGPGLCPTCSRPLTGASDQPIVLLSSRDYLFNYPSSRNSEEDYPDDNIAPQIEDLPSFVLRQIAPELHPNDRNIAAHILTSLDDNGLLTIPLQEISIYHHVPISRVQKVIRQIQLTDPIGVGSSSVKEALLVQLEVLKDYLPIPDFTELVIKDGLTFLSRHQYAQLSRHLGISITEIKNIAKFISENLNPYPGRAHWGDFHKHGANKPLNLYYHPDIIIHPLENNDDSPLVIEILIPLRGTLRINPLFRQSLNQISDDKQEKWKQDLERANLLIKCIQQRNHTMRRLMIHLGVIQRDFILLGDRYIKPITRTLIANMLEVHESTISRAVSSKTVQLPNNRIIPLSRFFDRSLHIRTAMVNLIENEDHNNPLTDNQIVDRLAEQGHIIARRTAAKYRSMEGILSARQRKHMYKSGMRP
jgi:RNA polymerase sigma-54 factor